MKLRILFRTVGSKTAVASPFQYSVLQIYFHVFIVLFVLKDFTLYTFILSFNTFYRFVFNFQWIKKQIKTMAITMRRTFLRKICSTIYLNQLLRQVSIGLILYTIAVVTHW